VLWLPAPPPVCPISQHTSRLLLSRSLNPQVTLLIVEAEGESPGRSCLVKVHSSVGLDCHIQNSAFLLYSLVKVPVVAAFALTTSQSAS
jgi:hypothetical protein